jgi:hypothetical protein
MAITEQIAKSLILKIVRFIGTVMIYILKPIKLISRDTDNIF